MNTNSLLQSKKWDANFMNIAGKEFEEMKFLGNGIKFLLTLKERKF